MKIEHRVRETLQRNAGIGIRFWDPAGMTSSVEGLRVEVFQRVNPSNRKILRSNPSGVYVGHVVPGLREFEFSSADPKDLRWGGTAASQILGYRIAVDDPLGRFLPVAFNVDLPWQGVIGLSDVADLVLPHSTFLPGSAESPPQLLIDRIPLFSAPARSVPQPLAVVYAQMREHRTLAIPAWSLLSAAIDGQLCGIGLADDRGQVAIMFPYPEPPRRPLSSPPEARRDFRWTVQLVAYWAPVSPQLQQSEPPDLADVLAQLAAPRTVIDSLSAPAAPWRLEYRAPMTVRTKGQSAADASYLLLSATQ